MQTPGTANTAPAQASGNAFALNDSFIPRKALAERLNVSESTTRNMQAAGVLAAPVRISARRVGWRRSYVEEFLATRSQVRS